MEPNLTLRKKLVIIYQWVYTFSSIIHTLMQYKFSINEMNYKHQPQRIVTETITDQKTAWRTIHYIILGKQRKISRRKGNIYHTYSHWIFNHHWWVLVYNLYMGNEGSVTSSQSMTHASIHLYLFTIYYVPGFLLGWEHEIMNKQPIQKNWKGRN